MPRDGDFKRLVRRRMRKTGEAYTTARAQLGGRPPKEGRAAVEPFDRFSRLARQALAAAHAEAAAAGGDIDGGHLLLGLLRVEEGMAAKALDKVGVDRPALARGLSGGAGPAPASAAPRLTGAASRAIELAVREAGALGHGFVGTEHLLLGILAAGDSAASGALLGAGVRLDRVREWVRGHPAPAPVAAAASRADAWKPLPLCDVPALLELAGRDRLTGAMRLRPSPPGGSGGVTLYFLFGQLFHAVHGDVVGEDAVLAALAWRDGPIAADFDARSRLPADGAVRATIPQLIDRARLGR